VKKLKASQISICFSILLHLSFYAFLTYLLQKKEPPIAEKPVEFEIIQTLAVSKPLALPPQKQMVEQEMDKIKKALDDAAQLLSETDRTVEKQTQAKALGAFSNSEEKPKNVAKDILTTLSEKVTDTVEPTKETQDTEPTESSKTDDYLRQVEVDKKTLLSTKEFAQYAYFKKIKEQIEKHWESGIKVKIQKLMQENRSIASDKGRVTKLLIILDRDGGLKTVQKVGSSGNEDLDDSAVQAFREAAPFPNPPENLVERDGTIKIRWDFILE
jgi:TonB family protein